MPLYYLLPLDYSTCVGIPNLFGVPSRLSQTVPDTRDGRLGRARRLIANKQVQTFPVLSAGQRNNDRTSKSA